MAIDTDAQGLALAARTAAALAVPIPQIAVLGDSKVAPDYNGSIQPSAAPPATMLKGADGYMAWALALAGQRVRMPLATHVWSYPGQETGTIRAALPAFLAQLPVRPSAVVVDCGTNNILHNGATGTFAAITADWAAIADLLAARGIRALFVPILPRDPTKGGAPAWTAAQYDTLVRCNRWLAELVPASRGWVAVAMAALPEMTDPASVGARPRDGMMVDGTHPGVLGAYTLGKAIAAILRHWYPPLDILPYSNDYPRPGATGGNLLFNGMMQTGTGLGSGTIVAPATGTIAGTVADAWRADMSATPGLAATLSLVASAHTGQPMQQIALGGSYTLTGKATYDYAQTVRIVGSVGSTGIASLAAGDMVEGRIAFEIDAGNNAISFPTLRLSATTGYTADLFSARRDLPGEAIVGVLRTPPYAWKPGDTSLNLQASAYLRSYPDATYTPAATIRFGRAAIYRID